MNSQNSQNLIGFLAKKSLFKTDSKIKETNFSDVNSVNDALSRSITPKAKNQSKSQISQFTVFKDASDKQLFKKGVSEIQKPSRAITNTNINTVQQNRFMPNDAYFSHVKKNANKHQNPEMSNFFKSPNNKSKNLFMGFNSSSSQKSSTKTFDSLQAESQRWLQNMSYRLQQEINSLNETVEILKAKMFKMLNAELQSLKQKVFLMVQEVFKESQKSIRTYIKQQQSQLLSQLMFTKNQLEQQYKKIQQMAFTIKTNEWRNTAAQMIASDLENHVDILVDKAKHVSVKVPEFNQHSKNDKLHELNKLFKELVNFQNWVK